MSGFLNAIDISASGLSVQRQKMNVVAENMANAETVETPEGGPYRRKRVVVKEDKTPVSFSGMLKQAGTRLARTRPGHLPGIGTTRLETTELPTVEAREEVDPKSSYKLVYDPGHPEADENGYVKMPDIEIINEMVDMIAASRGYEANTAVIASSKKMARDALDI